MRLLRPFLLVQPKHAGDGLGIVDCSAHHHGQAFFSASELHFNHFVVLRAAPIPGGGRSPDKIAIASATNPGLARNIRFASTYCGVPSFFQQFPLGSRHGLSPLSRLPAGIRTEISRRMPVLPLQQHLRFLVHRQNHHRPRMMHHVPPHPNAGRLHHVIGGDPKCGSAIRFRAKDRTRALEVFSCWPYRQYKRFPSSSPLVREPSST